MCSTGGWPALASGSTAPAALAQGVFLVIAVVVAGLTVRGLLR